MQNPAQGQFNVFVDSLTVLHSFTEQTLSTDLKAQTHKCSQHLIRLLYLDIRWVVPGTIFKCWNTQDCTTAHIYRDVIFIVCDSVLSETGASQSLRWRGPSGWEPAAQMSAVLQHSHSAHPSHGGPCLPQVSHCSSWLLAVVAILM